MARWIACFLLLNIATLSLADAPPLLPAQPPVMEARVDPRVELMSIIFRLAGNPEYNMPASKSPYADEVEKRFGPHRDDPVVKLARELRRSRGVSFDAVMSMAVHLRDLDGWAEVVPFDLPPERLDSRWPTDQAREFVRLARQFAKDTDFAGFVHDHQALYDATAQRLGAQLARHAYQQWFDQFFGTKPQARYYVVAGLLNGGGCYGMGVRFPDGREEISPIIGCWKFDDQSLPVFDDSFSDTIAHEFCHSYTNPIVDKHLDQLAPAAQRLWDKRREQMRQQAYGTWETMMRESLVRACVVRFTLGTSGQSAADRLLRQENSRGFTWVGGLAAVLSDYEAHREQYPTLEDFMPQVVAFFQRAADQVDAEAKAKPRITQMQPANGDTRVDPTLREMRIEFDRPMVDGSWALVGGGEHYPNVTGPPSYDPTCRILTVPIELKPNWQYELWLNRGKFSSFRSQEGVLLDSVHVTFKTGPAP